MLLVVMFMVFLMALALTMAAPKVAVEVKRDREEEMVHRGAQYARAIKKYFKKFGRYPTSLEQLKDTNHIRFLRKEYRDPMTQDGKWKLLHYGDVKMGGAGTGLAPSTMGTGLQGSNMGGLGSDSTANPPGQAPGAKQNPATRPDAFTGQTPTTNTGPGAQPQQFGAGAIIGVASMNKKEGLKEFNEKSHYNEWYFVYDPMTDRGGLINGPYTGKVFTGAGASGLNPSQGMPTAPGALQTTPIGGPTPNANPQQPPH